MKENKHRLINQVLPVSISIVALLSTLIIVGKLYFEEKQPYPKPNYLGLASLRLIPNVEARQPTKLDVDTGVRAKTPEGTYAFYQSNNISDLKSYKGVFAYKLE